MLMDRGFRLVRPLAGGLEAWVAAGHPVDHEQLIAIRQPESIEEATAGPAEG
jgi:3-mercaptopyruvate sulfurtransferase SseA